MNQSFNSAFSAVTLLVLCQEMKESIKSHSSNFQRFLWRPLEDRPNFCDHRTRDLWSFEIQFAFESDDSNSIRKWRADSKFSNQSICRRTTNQALFNKKLQPLRRSNWDLFYVLLFYVYVARAYTHYNVACSRVVPFPLVGLHNSCGNRHWTCKRLHPDSIQIQIVAADLIHDSIQTKISDSQVPTQNVGRLNRSQELTMYRPSLRHQHTQ